MTVSYPEQSKGLARFGWIALGYTTLVILFGAFVRASLSGDGCGAHWPTCNGEVFPNITEGGKMLVEFGHRVTSAVVVPLMIALVIWARKVFPRGHAGRRWSMAALIFTLLEAAIGAKLVLRGWVVQDDSVARVVVQSFHLVNTYFLLGAIAMTIYYAAGRRASAQKQPSAIKVAVFAPLVGMLLLGVTGAIAALGDTIFPVQTLREGIQNDFSPTAHFLERLRVLHPLIATSVGVLLMALYTYVSNIRPDQRLARVGKWVVGLYLFQMAFGLANLLLLAPVVMQVGHLLISNAIWIGAILFTAMALRTAPAIGENPVVEAPVRQRRRFSELVRDYVALTKPRVISLLLFTTLAAMVIAAREWPSTWLVLAVMIGGYMSAGSANAINMVIERDLDRSMERTSNRPTAADRMSAAHVLVFAGILAVGSFLILALAANLLTAVLATAGLAYYVVIYTLLLKRRTWQNIVIGGAAGAFPPLVGYAAIAGELTPLAWFLFALIFLWTPVHFWSLAILIKDDYARAGVPMLPVVLGDRVTVMQIVIYTILTAAISAVPLMLGQAGMFYLIVAAALNVGLLLQSIRLYFAIDRPHAMAVFKYSMVYLALMFLAIAVDRVGWS